MNINVHLFGILADHLPSSESGKGTLEMGEASTIKELFQELAIKRRVAFAVNGEHDLDENHMLQEGDEVLVFTSVSGG